jgi:hypothetical protein
VWRGDLSQCDPVRGRVESDEECGARGLEDLARCLNLGWSFPSCSDSPSLCPHRGYVLSTGLLGGGDTQWPGQATVRL